MRETAVTRDQILRAIHDLQHGTAAGSARNSMLARVLGVKGASVTPRVQELASAGLVNYVPRRGAALTDEGERLAELAITRLQLTRRFLVEVLDLPADAVAEEAEQFCRYVSDLVMDGIARYFKPTGNANPKGRHDSDLGAPSRRDAIST